MSDKQKAIYIGNGVKQNESWLKSSFCLTDIPKEHMFEFNGKKYIKVNINVENSIINNNQIQKKKTIPLPQHQKGTLS